MEKWFSLPEELIFDLFGHWIITEELVLLDRAISNRRLRSDCWLPCLRHHVFYTRGIVIPYDPADCKPYPNSPTGYLRWLAERGIKVRIIHLDFGMFESNEFIAEVEDRLEILRELDWHAVRTISFSGFHAETSIAAMTVLNLDSVNAPNLRHVGMFSRNHNRAQEIHMSALAATGIELRRMQSLLVNSPDHIDGRFEDLLAAFCGHHGLISSLSLSFLNWGATLESFDLSTIKALILHCGHSLRFVSFDNVCRVDCFGWALLLAECPHLLELDCGDCQVDLTGMVQTPWACCLTTLIVKNCVKRRYELPDGTPNHPLQQPWVSTYDYDHRTLRDAENASAGNPAFWCNTSSLSTFEVQGKLIDTDVLRILAFSDNCTLTNVHMYSYPALGEETILRVIERGAGVLSRFIPPYLSVSDVSVHLLADRCSASIEHLDLGSCYDITDASVIHLVKEIQASRTRMTLSNQNVSSRVEGGSCSGSDSGGLQFINLSHGPLTDNAVIRLVECCGCTLTRLHLYSVVGLTDAAVLQIAECCPKLKTSI